MAGSLQRPYAGWAVLVTVLLAAAPARADLELPESEVNLGDVLSGSPLTREFALVNGGQGVLEIVGAQASCGCLAPRLSKQTLQPGEKGSVSLEVNTLGQAAGPHLWSVRLAYRTGGQEREARVQVRANVIAEITVRPPALTVFVNQAVTHDIVLTDLRPKSLDVRQVRASSPHLKPRLAGPERDPAGHRVHRIRLEITADHPEGQAQEVVSIFTDDPRYPDLKVPVTVVKRRRQRLTTAPSSISLTAPRGQPVPSRILLIGDGQNGKVVIDRVTADHPAVACAWAEGPGERATVKVRVDHTRLPEDGLRGAVHVHVREPVAETLVVPLSCVVQ